MHLLNSKCILICYTIKTFSYEFIINSNHILFISYFILVNLYYPLQRSDYLKKRLKVIFETLFYFLNFAKDW